MMTQNHNIPHQQLPIHGKNVYLRPPKFNELEFVQRLWADPETMKPVGGPVEFSFERQKEWFKRMVKPGTPENFYCLIFHSDDTPVGEISFHRWNSEEKSADLNLKIHAAYRGQRYAEEALGIFLNLFFNVFGSRIMNDNVALDNFAGQQLLLSFGFQQNPEATDVCRMHMTKERYREIHGIEKA